MAFPQFQQLFSVSDIHLGGPKGFQIFDQGPALAWLVDHLRDRECDGDLALVLNGDIVDFLAEEPSMYLDAQGAVTKMERIIQDPSFSMVWKALGRFVRKPNRHLILVLGNHDVELALPEVRTLLQDTLCGQSDAARGRLTFAMDGNGFACMVGNARTLCIHGNEADNWNVVDYLALNRVIRAQNRAQSIPEWTPNAGTKMVIDIMNDLKRKHRWVDLLKPEKKAVLPLLLTLNPEAKKKLPGLGSVLYRLGLDGLRKKMHLLSAEEIHSAVQDADDFEREILMTLDEVPNAKDQELILEEMLSDLEEQVMNNEDPYRLLEAEDENLETLGYWRWIKDKVKDDPPEENIRKMLANWLADDKTWDLVNKDKSFYAIDKIVGKGIDFVLAGHTHLRRAIPRPNDPGVYLNSGTWIRLMAITKDMLDKEDQFSKLWQVLENGTMPVLDDPSKIGIDDFEVVRRIRTVTGLVANANGKVRGELFEVDGDGPFELVPVINSQFFRPSN